jgi:histidinol-phosphate aminotransferase
MDMSQKITKAARVGEIYNLDHFKIAWSDERRRRLMGNELVYPPSPKVIEAVVNMLSKANYYPEDASSDSTLRAKLGEYVGLPDSADWITLGNGSTEIIDLVYRTFVNDGDEVLIPTPDYSPYGRRLRLFGGEAIDVLPEDEDFAYSPDSFLKRITPKTKLVIASRPNNPTGYCLTEETILALCGADIVVVIDEAYVEFTDHTVEHLLADHSNLIITHTFSKAMGLAGFRLGFAIAQPEVIAYMNRVRTPLNISLITHHAALAALEDSEYIEANARRVQLDRAYLFDELKKIKGLRPIPSQANFVLINCRETGIKASEYYQHLFDKGYIVRHFVNARGLPGDEYFRITVGTRADVEAVLNEVKAFTAQRQRQPA